VTLDNSIRVLAHEPSIVKDCFIEKLFYLDSYCLCTSFYSCRFQDKFKGAVLLEGRPVYECVKHKPGPVINDIVDWINQLKDKPGPECFTGESSDGPETV